MLTPSNDDGPRHPLHRKPRLKVVLVGVVVVGVAAVLPPDRVSAAAQAVGAAAASTVVLRGTRQDGLMLGWPLGSVPSDPGAPATAGALLRVATYFAVSFFVGSCSRTTLPG